MVEFQSYEHAIEPARQRFAATPALQAMLAPDVDHDTLELFLLHFTALGVGMTEPVDRWIRRAGERCTAIGLPELGRALGMHAKHEAGHHLMMIADTRKLATRWNAHHTAQLSADTLLDQPATPGVQRYRALHEDIIEGPNPYCQLAIEYEIERLSITHGPALMGHCASQLGADVVHGLSFLEEHIEVDAGHTKFNAAELGRLVAGHAERVAPLVQAGGDALDAYAAFLADCVAGAVAWRQRQQG
jgi:hypothetical protein